MYRLPMGALAKVIRRIGRFFGSLRLGEDPAGDRLVAGDHARHLHSGLYSTPRPPDREDPYEPGRAAD
jgi:hypothetical protein